MKSLKSNKLQILIIETDDCKFFAAKQVLKSQLKIDISTDNASTPLELAEKSSHVAPDVVFCCPEGGIIELLAELKKRQTNRRNSEITLLLAEGLAETLIMETHTHELTQLLQNKPVFNNSKKEASKETSSDKFANVA